MASVFPKSLRSFLYSSAAVGASFATIGLVVLTPRPSHALVGYRVDGYITARVAAGAPLNSSFAVGDRLRFGFQIRNIPVTTDSATTNTWQTSTTTTTTPSVPYNRIFSNFTIGKCSVAANTDDCSSFTDILSSQINYSQVNNLFSVTPVDGSWTTTDSAPEQVNLGLRVFATFPGNTGMVTQINGSATSITNVDFGAGSGILPFSLPVPAYDWLRVGNTTVSPTISNLTAENIIQNIGTTSGYTPLTTANGTGRLGWGPSTFASLNVNGIKLEEVPGPLPVLGSLAAFAYSRKLRSRIRAHA